MADYTVTGQMTLDITPFLRSMMRAEQQLSKVERDLSRVDKLMEKISKRNTTLKIAADTRNAEAGIKRVEQQLNALENRTIRINTITDNAGGIPAAGNQTRTITTQFESVGEREVVEAIDRVGDAADRTGQDVARMAGHMDVARSRSGLMTAAILTLGTAAIPVVGVAAGVAGGLLGVLGTGIFAVGAAALGVIPAGKELTSVFEAQANVASALASGDIQKIALAYQQQQNAMAGLSAEGRTTVAMLTDLKTQFSEFGEASGLRDDVFNMFNNGIQLASSLMERAEPIAQQAVRGFRDLTALANERLETGAWDNWFRYVETESRGFITNWGTAVMNFTEGVGNMIIALDPLSDMVTNGFRGMSESFLQWSQTLDSNQSFQNFIQFVETNGPKVWETIKSIGSAFIDLGVALAPLGSTYLSVIKQFADILSALVSTPIGAFVVQMGVLAATVRTLGTALGVGGLIGSLGRFAPAAAGATAAAGGLGRVLGGAAAGAVAGGAARAAAGTGLAARAMGGLALAGRGAVAMLGGPWGVAITGAVVGMSLYSQKIAENQQRQREHIGDLANAATAQTLLGSAAGATGTKMTEQRDRIAELTAQTTAAEEKARGLSTAQYEVAATIDGSREAYLYAKEDLTLLTEEVKVAEAQSREYIAGLSPLEAAQLKVTIAQEAYNKALESNDTEGAAAAARVLAEAEGVLARETHLATQELMTQTEKTMAAFGGQMNLASAAINVSNAQLQAKDALKQYNEAIAAGKQGTDEFIVLENNLATAMMNSMGAAGENAATMATFMGVQDTAAISTVGMWTEMQRLVAEGGKVPPAMQGVWNSMQSAGAQTSMLTGVMDSLGLAVNQIPNSKAIHVESAAPEQIQLMRDLGLHVIQLPDGSIYVTADTQEALNRMAEVERDRDAQIKAIAETATAGGELDITARTRDSAVNQVPDTNAAERALENSARRRESEVSQFASVNAAENDMNNAARHRDSPVTQVPSVGGAEDAMNNAARHRDSPVTQVPSVTAAENDMNNAARHRDSPVTQQPNTGGAEWALTSTARWRESLINATANSGLAEAILNSTARTRTAVINAVVNGAQAVAAALPWTGGVVGGGGKGFWGGGLVQGAGTGLSDSIPAFTQRGPIAISNGEYIVRAAAVDKLGLSFMNMVNAGRIPPYRGGGQPVTSPGWGSSSSGRGSDDDGPSIGMVVEEGAVVVHNHFPTDTGTSVNRELSRLSSFGAFSGGRRN